jgi:hypothetical protein
VLAQNNLGILFDEGRGVPRDARSARDWYQQAADRGNANAQYNLALLYDEGRGAHQDLAAAAHWYRKAAEKGHGGAQYNMGVMSAQGDGAAQDYVSARTWAALAADYGQSDEVRVRAEELRDALAELMSGEQIAEADRRVREWQPAG